MPMLEELVAEIDTVATEVTQIRVFPLRFATASVMAQSITSVFSPSTANQRTGGRTAATTTGGRFAFFGGMRGGNADQATQSARRLEEQTVVAVADERTNSVIVLASAASMEQIAQMVENLDSNPARQKKVHVYSLENADPETVNQILNQMFGGTNTRQTTTNRNRRNGRNGNRRHGQDKRNGWNRSMSRPGIPPTSMGQNDDRGLAFAARNGNMR
jgi:general secretion pathway protein D